MLNLPRDGSVEGDFSEAYAAGTGFLPGGIGWYHKHFTLPADQQGKRVLITFDGVYHNSEVWLNGVRLGDLRDSTPFQIATRRLRKGRLLSLVQARFAEGEIRRTASVKGNRGG